MTSSKRTIWHFFLFCNNEGNHINLTFKDHWQLSVQPYHVIHIEHTHTECPLLAEKSALVSTRSDATRKEEVSKALISPWYQLIHSDTFWCIWFHQNTSGKKRLGEISDDAFQRVLMQHGRRKCQERSLVKVSFGERSTGKISWALSAAYRWRGNGRGAPGLGRGCL